MQWVEKIIKFFSIFFRSFAFQKRYRTKKIKDFKKIVNNKRWQVVDVRNSISYENHHISGSINLPKTVFMRRYYKTLDHKKKILILNDNYRSNLDLYRILEKHSIKSYVLVANYNQDIRNNELLDEFTTVTLY